MISVLEVQLIIKEFLIFELSVAIIDAFILFYQISPEYYPATVVFS